MNGAIQPTVTQHVRSFMMDQGEDVKPWTGLDETYGELYALLNRRRDDPGFWPPLAAMLQQVVDGAVDPNRPGRLSAPQAELLASWDVEQLIEDLRAALPGGEPPHDTSAIRGFASRVSSAVMGGFLLLGLASASGCSDDTDVARDAAVQVDTAPDAKATPDAGASDMEAWFAKCNLANSSVLWSSIDKSSLKAGQKKQLCDCFDSLNKSWADGLTTLFSSGSAKEIAGALEHMLSCCNTTNKSKLNQDYDKAKAEFLKSQLCKSGVPLYKGVSFPEK